MDAERRLAALLVMLGEQIGRMEGNTVSFELPMSRAEMGRYLALAPETLSRTITRFKARQLLETRGRRQFTLPDWDGLCHLTPYTEVIRQEPRRRFER
jgi:CRP/FNR family transcriptional regulator